MSLGRYRDSIDQVIRAVLSWPLSAITESAWRAHFATVPLAERSTLCAQRRLSLVIRDAQAKVYCMYCWMPGPTCMCSIVPDLSHLLGGRCFPVMVFHADEFLRRSNSGHMVAMLFDTPIVVEGIPSHEPLLRGFGVTHPRDYIAIASAVEAGAPLDAARPPEALVRPAVLFPAQDAVDVTQFAASTEALGEPVVIALMDGTWSQGNSMNRRFDDNIPRVIINIPKDYDSLFAPLREQTRSTGVSTLEATVMALHQIVEAQGRLDDAQLLTENCIVVMKTFVDVVRLQKNHDPAYPDVSGDFISTVKKDFFNFTADRHRKLFTGEPLVQVGPEAELAPPWKRYVPVVNYCYCCDLYIGWSRMDLHVRGSKHKENYERRGFNWTPSRRSQEMLRRPGAEPRLPSDSTNARLVKQPSAEREAPRLD